MPPHGKQASRPTLERALEETFEHVYDPMDALVEYRQVPIERVGGHRPLIERYAKGEVGLYAYLRAGVDNEYVAVIYRPLPARKRHARLNALRHREELEVEERGGDGEATVLVDSVQVVDDPQRVEDVPIVPVVRLFFLNEPSGAIGNPVQPFGGPPVENVGAVSRLPLAVLVSHNRVHQHALDVERDGAELTLGERVNRVIERGAEILDGVASEDADSFGRGILDLRPSNCVARLGIYLTTWGAGLRPTPAIDGVLDGFYVLACPVEL